MAEHIQLLYSGYGNDVFIKGYEPHTTGERGRERGGGGGEGREMEERERWRRRRGERDGEEWEQVKESERCPAARHERGLMG